MKPETRDLYRYGGEAAFEIEDRANEGEAETAPIIRGYAAVFGTWSEDLGGFRERIAPGAFAKSLGGDVRALWQHDSAQVIGRTKSGTLRLEEDGRGLRVEITPPRSTLGRHIVELIRRRDVDQMSFGFRTRADAWSQGADGLPERTLVDVDLIEVSPVTFPAYPTTEAAMRSLEDFRRRSAPDAAGSIWALRARLSLVG